MSLENRVPLIIGIVPLLVFHLTHVLSAAAGHVPWCIPYWQGCTSISATGRAGLSFYVFKAVMLPAAVLLWWFWRGCWRRLLLAEAPGSRAPGFLLLGTLGAIFLSIYTAALGLQGDNFQLARRIGVICFFGFTFLSQLLFTWHLERRQLGGPLRHLLTAICLTTLLAGLLTVILDVSLANYADYEDSFEWSITLLMQMYFVASHWVWRSLGNSRPAFISYPK
jgi:hypothetical protein